MTFWNWRRGSVAASSAGTAAVAISTELAPIELYTADARIVGWVAANGRRVTDLLNESDALRLWRPHPGPIEAPGETSSTRADPPTADDDSGEWQTLLTEQVVLAMPPEWRASRQLRLHRKLRRVAVKAGPFSVTGNLHMAPGAEPGMELLLRSPRFLPLTEAYMLHDGEPPFEHVVSVVIVGSAHVSQMVPLVTLA
ncbi:MAG TPA: hypothetical protein VF013_09850 [Candidatus Limnocylindria bacterium]